MQSRSDEDRRMIVNCCGGLGNQMFIYAAGLYFSETLQRALEVVKPPAEHQQFIGYKRPFQLDAFRIQVRARDAGLLDRLFFSSNRRLKNWHGKIGRLCDIEVIAEPNAYQFYAGLGQILMRKRAYFSGYFQAAGYARVMDIQLREQFRLRSPLQNRNRKYAELIQSLKCPISIHLRLGDFALISHAAGAQGLKVSNILPMSYYEHAIHAVRDQFEECTLVIFSDEPARARKLLQGTTPCVFIEGADMDAAYEDLWLMSLCKHNIIANSSFSWWGAWLNTNPNKLVLAPRYWFNTLESNFPDLYPSEWTIIDNI